MEEIQDVHPIIEKGEQVALIDNTDFDDVKVILTDTPEKYVQRFFVKASFESLLERTRAMRSCGIPTL